MYAIMHVNSCNYIILYIRTYTSATTVLNPISYRARVAPTVHEQRSIKARSLESLEYVVNCELISKASLLQ